ncbi:MAG: flagellar basal body-associated FliL family protein [Planctomycetota bacterium]
MPPENDNATNEGRAKRRLPIKSMLIIALIMLAEGGLFAVYVVMKPSPQSAEAAVGGAEPPEAQTAEAVIIESGRFPNRKTGRLYMYDLEIAVQVDKTIFNRVEKMRTANEALIRDRIRAIIARADPSYFDEHELRTLKRQIKAMLDEVFGDDTVKEVFIKTCNPYRIE